MKKYTMKDYVEETYDIALENVEKYESLTDELYQYCMNKDINRIWFVASGSSYNALQGAYPFMKKLLPYEVKMVTPYTFTYYENHIGKEDVIIVITQSGLSTNAIQAIQKVNQLGLYSICLTGNVDSDVKLYAKKVIDYGVKEELVGYVTKGVSLLTLFLFLWTIRFVPDQKTNYLSKIKQAILYQKQVKEKTYAFIQEHYQDLSSMRISYCCGAGGSYGVALEGALKIGETIHIPSFAYEIEEYIHGPNLQLTPNYTVFIFDTNDEASSRISQIYEATKKVTNHTFMISNHKLYAQDKHVLYMDMEIDTEFLSFIYLPFVQLISYVISSDLQSVKQHPLLKEFKKIADAKTENFVNYDDDE